MKIEHFAINVAKPQEMASWYVENLGMSVARKLEAAPFTHFLADSAGSVMLEIYNNPADEVPDYRSMHPLLLHLAFTSRDVEADRARLEAVGATFVVDETTPAGDRLIMLRDPWGFAIQLCSRSKEMI